MSILFNLRVFLDTGDVAFLSDNSALILPAFVPKMHLLLNVMKADFVIGYSIFDQNNKGTWYVHCAVLQERKGAGQSVNKKWNNATHLSVK